MDFGPHATFIWSSYGAVAVVLGALVIGLWLDGRRQARDLAALEAKGLGRSRDGDEPLGGS
jgi:heme exporter protein CcmD